MLIVDILGRADQGEKFIGQKVIIAGWVKNSRQQNKGELAFLSVADGSCMLQLQMVLLLYVLQKKTMTFKVLDNSVYPIKDLMTVGTSVVAEGEVVKSLGKGQVVELKVTKILNAGLISGIFCFTIYMFHFMSFTIHVYSLFLVYNSL